MLVHVARRLFPVSCFPGFLFPGAQAGTSLAKAIGRARFTNQCLYMCPNANAGLWLLTVVGTWAGKTQIERHEHSGV